MNDAMTVYPDEVASVLLRGDHEWRDVTSVEPGFWRIEDGSSSPRGKRGWIIEFADGERVCCDVTSIEGVR